MQNPETAFRLKADMFNIETTFEIIGGDDSDAKQFSISDMEVSYTARGLRRYRMTISHAGLNKIREIKGNDPDVVLAKARALGNEWANQWKRIDTRMTNEQNAEERTKQAVEELDRLRNLLKSSLSHKHTFDWESLKSHAAFSKPKPLKGAIPLPPQPDTPREPKETDEGYRVKHGLLDRIFAKRANKKANSAINRFNLDHIQWVQLAEQMQNHYTEAIHQWEQTSRKAETDYKNALAEWESENEQFLSQRNLSNDEIDLKASKFITCDPLIVIEYFGHILSDSAYPDYFQKEFDLWYNPENKILIADYQLPDVSAIPKLFGVKYAKSTGEFVEKNLTTEQLNELFDSVLYQTTLRCIHELYAADYSDILAQIVLNGYVEYIDAATGNQTTACVLSIQVSKDEFLNINLSNVDPKVCFKKLKGISASKLHSMAPVAPLLEINREDKRFTSAYSVINTVDLGHNLALMDWEDFEHLVRELFEKEFATGGAEVKVTRASRDGGVDAVVFDPDPIKGGKFIIQAKRYANTVGVSAVRDLYGTVINEGAGKGILVTTSDYGPDAYDFAKGKPLVLLNGGNLLHLLAKHGHKAHIDLVEARRSLEEANKN